MPARPQSRVQILVALALAGLLAFAAVTLWMGSKLSAPAPTTMPPAPNGARVVSFPSESGSLLSGWLFPGGRCGSVVLMHGVRADRRSMLTRAEFLAEKGYSILLFDFQAHGESPGSNITFGYLESLDAAAAVDFVRRLSPSEPVGAIGSSLGGASTLVGSKPLDVDVLVLEAVYPTLRSAVDNRIRIRLGLLSRLLTPVLLAQLGPRLGFGVDDMRPIDGIAWAQSPVLIIAGSDDQHTTLADSQRLFEAAPEPKSLWIVEGAAHVDFLRHDPERYRSTVGGFLGRHLGCPDMGLPRTIL